MKLNSTEFVFLAVVLVAVVAEKKKGNDDKEPCYTEKCIKEWNDKSDDEAKKDKEKCFPGGKLNGAEMKTKNNDCAIDKYKESLDTFATNCDGKGFKEFKDCAKVKIECNMMKGLKRREKNKKKGEDS